LPGDDPAQAIYENGVISLRLEVIDLAGNQNSTTVPIDVSRIQITNLALSPEVIDPLLSEQATISYDLTHAADVSMVFYTSGTANQVATVLTDDPRPAGPQIDFWDGTTDGSQPAPNDAYFVSITATDAEGRSTTFNAPGSARMGAYPNWSIPLFNGEPDLPASIDFYQNEELLVTYEMDGPGWHSIHILPNNVIWHLPPAFPLRDQVRLPTGPTSLVWNGRLATGEIHEGVFASYFEVSRNIEMDFVFVRTPPLEVTTFQVNPYVFKPMYSEVSNIRYDLTRDAHVQIDVNGQATTSSCGTARTTAARSPPRGSTSWR
jgi:hypothetical protein